MVELERLVEWCNRELGIPDMADFPGAENGLQVRNSGKVTRIGAAVDAGVVPFERAIERGIDFLMVHHGMFWDKPYPLTGPRYERVARLIRGNCALYSAHLPLDAHQVLGNNAILASRIGLGIEGNFGDYNGVPIGCWGNWESGVADLEEQLRKQFPKVETVLSAHPSSPRKVGVLTGSGSSVIPLLEEEGIDTLITGELKQNCFNLLQEAGIQAYLCGHYATEVFGVQALAQKAAETFGLEWEFIDTRCPL